MRRSQTTYLPISLLLLRLVLRTSSHAGVVVLVVRRWTDLDAGCAVGKPKVGVYLSAKMYITKVKRDRKLYM